MSKIRGHCVLYISRQYMSLALSILVLVWYSLASCVKLYISITWKGYVHWQVVFWYTSVLVIPTALVYFWYTSVLVIPTALNCYKNTIVDFFLASLHFCQWRAKSTWNTHHNVVIICEEINSVAVPHLLGVAYVVIICEGINSVAVCQLLGVA